jgi:hypothetical protein
MMRLVAGLLHHRLGDAHLVHADAHHLEGAVDRVDALLRGERLARFVDLEREVDPALQVEPQGDDVAPLLLVGEEGESGEQGQPDDQGHPDPVLMTFTPRKRAGGQPCETALLCEGWPLPSLNEPPTK